MPRPDRLWLVLLAGTLALAVGGCKSHPKAKLGPSEAPVYSVRDPEGVRQQVRWQELLTLAGRDIQGGNLDAAERKAREAQKLVPTAPDGLVLLAGIDERRGRSQQAGENFRKAAELAPQRGDVLNNYGAWLCQQGQAAESLVWFDRAQRAPGNPAVAEAQSNAGSCALDAGQFERAESEARKARRGLWKDVKEDQMPPWRRDWLARQRQPVLVQEALHLVWRAEPHTACRLEREPQLGGARGGGQGQ